MATSKMPYQARGWKHLVAADANNYVQAVIPSQATEIMFILYAPTFKIFSSKVFPKHRIDGTTISVVYEGTSDINNLLFGTFTCTDGEHLTYRTDSAKWGGVDGLYNATADIYWK